MKERRLRAFVDFVMRETGGDLKKIFGRPTDRLREHLLAVHGIGPETADSMLLYAGEHPVFVVDAYTRRVLTRHGWRRSERPMTNCRCFSTGRFRADP